MMEKWPNFFIVGVPKGGTTSLHEYLNDVPGIFMSKIKEPYFFSPIMIPDKLPFRPVRDKKKYLALFKNAKDEKIIGESSTLYFFDPEAPNLIHKKTPHARILISLRDPIERLFSHYLLTKKEGFAEKTFHEQIQKELRHEVDYTKPHMRLEAGMYSKCVNKYLDKFGANQVKIIIFEEWIKNPKKIVEDIMKFLDIDQKLEHSNVDDHNPYTVNRWNAVTRILMKPNLSRVRDVLPYSTRQFIGKSLEKEVKKPKMEEKEREFLKKFYKDDVEKLKKILGRNLPWPNFQN